ncbi:LexA family protein [Candidatus Magnetobacterium casense]|uniref:LexA repressor DNA-binding domain-containing protein n=1 Tax=Candidatus Magnetobacterium casense TaxID=1455061 RepID=A0ABS6S0F7_9BACT|nr:hypothetical protein [Candidatus Magnetobacterium casensis]MBV6342347.1 hypothetical protein [Candidatus Magnetobacterium casensis]
MVELTEIQRETFKYIVKSIEETGVQPSFEDMCEHFDVTLKSISDRVTALERKGWLKRLGKHNRSLKILRGKFSYVEGKDGETG